jgi:anaerobic selenocysteine-containing dehydrogenase
MHPEDAAALGLADGDRIRVLWDGEEAGAAGPLKADPECSPGAVYFTRRIIPGGVRRVKEMEPLDGLPGNPARVRVRRAEG